MNKDNSIYLEDIVNACEKILTYVDGASSEQFTKDDMLKDAVMRNIEIIGEAASKLTQEFKENHPEFPVRDATTMRNKIIHEYDIVDFEIVWETVQSDIPKIKNLSENILKKLSKN